MSETVQTLAPNFAPVNEVVRFEGLPQGTQGQDMSLTQAATPAQAVAMPEPQTPQIHIQSQSQAHDERYIDEGLWKMCQLLTQSSLIPAQLKSSKLTGSKAVDCYFVAMTGFAFGIKNPAIALQSFYIVGSTLTMSVRAKLGLVEATKSKVEVRYDEKKVAWTCTITRKDNGAVNSITYGLEDAITAGKMFPDPKNPKVYIGDPKSAWGTHWKDMLRTRAIGKCCDIAFADLMLGIPTKEVYEDEYPGQTVVQVRYPEPQQQDNARQVIDGAAATQQDLQSLINN